MVTACRDCGEVKPLDAFYPAPRCLANLRPACRRCNRRKAARWPFSLEEVAA